MAPSLALPASGGGDRQHVRHCFMPLRLRTILDRQHPVHHLAGEPEVVGRIAQAASSARDACAARSPCPRRAGRRSGLPVADRPCGRCRRRGRARAGGRAWARAPSSPPPTPPCPLVMSRLARMRFGVHLQAGREEAALRQAAGGEQEDLRQRDPFDLPRAGRALVVLDHGVEQGGHVLPHQALRSNGCRRHEIGLRFCGMVLDEPRPSWNGSNTSSTSVCIISFTSIAILPSVPVTRPRKQPTSAMRSRTVCQAISGWPSPSSCISAACTFSPSVPSDDSVPAAPPNSPTSTRGRSSASRCAVPLDGRRAATAHL